MISNDEYGQLLEEHSSTQSSLAANKIISGTILNISDQSITVDIGHKSEGQIPKDEFISSGSLDDLKVGGSIEVFIDQPKGIERPLPCKKENAKLSEYIGKTSNNL